MFIAFILIANFFYHLTAWYGGADWKYPAIAILLIFIYLVGYKKTEN